MREIPSRTLPSDQADGLRRMFAGSRPRFVALASNPHVAFAGVLIERLTAAYTALGPGPRGRSVRTERYRYTEWAAGRQGAELYDYQTDPNELTNHASDPAYAEALVHMKRLLHAGPGPATKP